LELGRNIAKWRKKRGFNQRELAREVGISEDYLSMIERGKRNPHIRVIVQIAFIIEVELKELLHED
jgi:putative transcriptional regulator